MLLRFFDLGPLSMRLCRCGDRRRVVLSDAVLDHVRSWLAPPGSLINDHCSLERGSSMPGLTVITVAVQIERDSYTPAAMREMGALYLMPQPTRENDHHTRHRFYWQDSGSTALGITASTCTAKWRIGASRIKKEQLASTLRHVTDWVVHTREGGFRVMVFIMALFVFEARDPQEQLGGGARSLVCWGISSHCLEIVTRPSMYGISEHPKAPHPLQSFPLLALFKNAGLPGIEISILFVGLGKASEPLVQDCIQVCYLYLCILELRLDVQSARKKFVKDTWGVR